MEIKDTGTPCNCPWLDCPIHPRILCPYEATALHMAHDDCEHCENQWVYLGDKTLGDGIHICHMCATVLMNIYTDEVCEFMGKLNPFVPVWLHPLESLCRTAYHDKIDVGWINPHDDALGVLAFAYIVIQIEQIEHKESTTKIPLKMIEGLLALTVKVKNIRSAYRLDSKEVHVRE